MQQLPDRRVCSRLLLSLISAWVVGNSAGKIAEAQMVTNSKYQQPDKFRQLEEVLPTPNDYRSASGAPGHEYWQQKVDYVIDVELDDAKQRIIGRETITYTNNSPDTLTYLWLQLDANMRDPKSGRNLSTNAPSLNGNVSFDAFDAMLTAPRFQGATKIREVSNPQSGRKLHFEIVRTSMRVDLSEPLSPGDSFTFVVAWDYNISNGDVLRGRSGFEHFEADKNNIYEMAQWFPRLCAYTEVRRRSKCYSPTPRRM